MWPGNVRIPLYMQLDASLPPPSTRKLSVWPLDNMSDLSCSSPPMVWLHVVSSTLSVFIFNLYQTCRRWAGYFMPRMSRTSIFFCLYFWSFSPAICYNRQQLSCQLPHSGDCEEPSSHVTTSPCLQPSGDTVECRLTSVIRVRCVANKPYSNFSFIVPHGLAIMFSRMVGVRVEEQPWPNLPVQLRHGLHVFTFPATLSVQGTN